MDTVAVLTRIQSSGLVLQAAGDRLVVTGNQQLTEQQRQFIRQHKASLLKALAATPGQSTGTIASAPVALAMAVTTPLTPRIEIPDPAPEERLCYQCQHFAKSPYGYPLGLCVEHGNRIQHRTSEPTKFGCGTFEPKEGRA